MISSRSFAGTAPSPNARRVPTASGSRNLSLRPFSPGAYFYLRCRPDLTQSVGAQLLACSMIPEQLRQKVQVAAEATQKLLKRSRQPEGLFSHASATLAEPRPRAAAPRAISGAFSADWTPRWLLQVFGEDRPR